MAHNRREYLTLLALVTTGTLAGCTSDDEAEVEPVDDDEEEEVNDADTEDGNGDTDDDTAENEDDDDELRQMELSFGDTVEHPDGFHITPFEPNIIESYETEGFDGTETIEPENDQFVFIEIEVENVIESTIQTPNALSFRAIVNGEQYERVGLAPDQPDDFERYPSLEDLAPGSSASGELVFDTGSGDVELFYNDSTEDLEEIEAIWS